MAILRCSRCQRPIKEALELLNGPICRTCLQESAVHDPLDDLAALVCASVVTEDFQPKEDV